MTETGSWAGHQSHGQHTEPQGRGEAGLEDGRALTLIWIAGVQVPPLLFLSQSISDSGFNFAKAQKETWVVPTHMVCNLACTLIHGRN